MCSEEHVYPVGTCLGLIQSGTSMKQRLLEDQGERQRTSEGVNQYSFAFVKRLGRRDCCLNASNGEDLIKLDGKMLGEKLPVS